MAQMVKRTNYDAHELDVLLNPVNAHEIGIQVSNAGVSETDNEGNKIIKAGTPVGGSVSALETRNTVLAVKNDGTAQGVLRHDVVFRNGSTVENATLIVMGVVDTSKCPTISAEAKGAMSHIVFQNGGR